MAGEAEGKRARRTSPNPTMSVGGIVIVEGTVGAGKTTLGQALVAHLETQGRSARFFEEPCSPALLEAFLRDQARHALTFQLVMLTARKAILREAQAFVRSNGARAVAVVDRGLLGDQVFANVQTHLGHMSADDAELYARYRAEADSPPGLARTVTLFLDVAPETAAKRIARRNRPGEVDAYSSALLQCIDAGYRQALAGATPLVVPWDAEGGSVEAVWQEVLRPALEAWPQDER
jgi:deoxyadenosine/deoxycytidine kinase